ncbi:protein MFI [Pseudoliparis swirei]|uniref:protein MFI n=1 Tax=Pseudoliparis swirei TaxID=2059687 RepID=UPI0024BEA61A|nr:protein MFI [Pseudoliparis swirei]
MKHQKYRVQVLATWHNVFLPKLQNREVFKYFKELIGHFKQQDPRAILKAVNPREAELLDAGAGVFIRFRLGGITFPPNIYYKIFTYRPITDLCASSPKDYTQPSLKKPVSRQERPGWYQRTENNSWRLFCSKVVPMNESKEIGANKKMEFHYSRLQRQQDVDKWRQGRKIEWRKKMYKQGRQQTQLVHRHMAATTLVVNSGQEAVDGTEEKGQEEVLDLELEEMMAWTNTLNFEEYMQQWLCLACSHSSEPSHGEHLK